ncbi:neuron navigator 1 isoform X1 [Perca fluviatilis]|uniref:neuron navigator 1 isoform X1 n=2 Tax=Perca fluviatilis TaxID=8168 RepID=UPI00196260E7|nr:neuron navigator 1 isoform X1 [Perca fluviatilis]XP_039654711.1 neuron navigator 1 isoform X1 [Perca fluviatilis]
MSGGVNIKVISPSQSDAGVISSLPLPRSMMPLSKMDPKQHSGTPNPTLQYQHAPKRRPSYSPSSVSSGPAELLRGTALKNHLLQHKVGMNSHRSPAATERTDGTCSAYSSPQIPKREVRRSKDTLDLRASTLNQKALRDLQLRRTTNKNWTFGKYRLKSVDNAHEDATFGRLSADVQSGHGRGRLFYTEGANGNEISGVPLAGMGNTQKKARNLSNQHLGASERDVSNNKSKSSHHTFNMRHKGSEPGKVYLATVAPFRFRVQVHEDTDTSLDDLSDCSSDSMEVCCDDLGGMLGNSVKGREGDFKMERADSTKAYGQADGKGVGMAVKRAKSGVPQTTPRGELKVYRAGSSDGRLPVPSSLRKQRSMTNLAVLTDAEKKLHLYEPKWCDDMAKHGAGQTKMGKPKTAGGGSSAGGGGPLSRNLSKSEHSLFQGKPKPFSPLAAPSALSKQSRIPRAPYAEVKPLSKAPEDGKSDDEILSSKAKANAKKQGAGAGGESGSKGEEGGDKPFLKVDPELVVTVLGDLEQLLFSQMLDPESQRKRTVQNVLDLRQNLEDTMSSLRGSQISHSCMDSSNVGYDSDETNARSISSLSNRSSPLSWRQGQSSPRLQAGDAPSSTGGGYQGSKTGSQYTAHTMPARCSSRLSSTSRIELIEGLDDADLKSGYLSDSDLLGKSLPHDDDDNLANGWDESSSISSGLSDGDGDGSENLSSEEFNVSSSLNSLPTTPLGSRRNSSAMLRTDAEKRSLVESGLSWYSEDGKTVHKLDSCSYDTGSLKSEAPSKWRKKPPSLSEDTGCKGELRKPQSLGHPGSFKKGRNPPIGVTSPITHTSQSTLKVAAPKSEKPLDKSRISLKTAGLQRSRSDAGRDHHGEHRKPPSGLVKPTAGASFGYKKQPTATGTATVMTAGGTTISSGSATVGKTPKSSGIPVKPVGGGTPSGRKNSFDASSEQSFLGPNARNSIQYRSLPRPAKSSTLSVIGRPAPRPVSGTIDPSLLSLKPVPMASTGPKIKEPSSCSSKMSNRTSTGPVNMTDREKEKERAKAKAVGADGDCGSLKGETQSTGESTVKLHGLRRTGSSKYPELSSPTTPRMLNTKSLGRPTSLAHVDKMNFNSLDSCVTIHDLPPKVPPYSKLQDLAGSHTSSRLTPSPAPVLHIDSPSSYTSESLSLSGSPLLYPKLSGMHRSMESLPLQMSVASSARFVRTEIHDKEERGTGTWGAGSRTSLNLTDSLQTDRNTLPKKGLERYGSSLSESDGKPGRRHSHNIVSMTESDSPPQLPSPTRPLHPSSGKAPLTNVVAPITSGTPRISRSNSIGPPSESACDLYGSSPLGSSMSLADRPKSMMRCGSFREPGDDVHGSVLSLASNASSNYSSNEERIQGEQIRKLRRELESSQEKVADLTMQLSANLGQANLVAAFEQSLALMTARLQTLSVSSEQKIPSVKEKLPGDIVVLEMSCESKDSELTELKDTIEVLRVKNTEAQEIIQGALSNPDITPKELLIKRQNSSESISSLTSNTSHTSHSSHSSLGSLKEQEAKKKKKKGWVFELRSSFNKAFSKKGSKPSGPYADIEEISTPESSAPSSPKVHHGGNNPPLSMKSSASTSSSGLCEGDEVGDDKVVTELRTELWEKERKLTDIRLEALSSAHQLEQLQEAMTNMQSTVENLKAENDHLKTGGLSPCPSPGPSSSVSQSSGLTALGSLSPRQSVAMHVPKSYSRGLSEGGSSADVHSADFLSLSSQRDDHRVRVVICVADLHVFKDEVKQQDFFVGTVRVNGRMDWPMLDSAVSQAFKVYIAKVDPTSSLGLSTDSIYSYSMGHIKRVLGGEGPETQPSRCMSRGPSSITVALKGLKEKCVDSLVFETLIPKPMMQHYISLLLKHRRLILSGPSGTGKSYLASRLAEYLVDRSAREVTDGIVVTFNLHRQSCKDLQLYLSNLANHIDRETSTSEIPLVIILDDIHGPASISELVNGALTCKYHKCPYIIGTSNQPVKMIANHGLHLSFRMVTFSNNVEPANGFLVRYLHRKLMESEDERSLTNEDLIRVLDWVPKLWYHLHAFLEKHSTSDFLIGPCFFLSCPVTVDEFRSWFIDLWNHSIIPYLQEGAKDGIKVHGQKAVWEDPVEWVRGTLPWPSAQQDQAKLFHLPPPSIGSSSPGQPCEERPHKETPPSSMESDPLMAMLLKLQEAANYIESPDKEDPSLPRL